MREQRRLFRVTVARDGFVRRGAERAPCAITELTPDGVGFTTELTPVVGETVEVEFFLSAQDLIQGAVLITHRAGSAMGGRFVALAPDVQRRLDRFIDEHSAVSLFAC